MPLAERDINTQREPRVKRHSTRANLSYTRLRDENSPLNSPASKGTPPSSRLLAPTKASAAKASTPSARAIGQTATPSRLPRRMDSSIASPKTTAASTRSSVLDSGSSTPTPMTDKPLPAPPVAQIRTATSPIRSSRTLVDASEKSMRIRGYSPLTPRAGATIPLARPPSVAVPSATNGGHSSYNGQTDTIFSPDRWANDVSNGLIDTALSATDLTSPGTVPSLESSYSSLNSITDNVAIGHEEAQAAVEQDLVDDWGNAQPDQMRTAKTHFLDDVQNTTPSTKPGDAPHTTTTRSQYPMPDFSEIMIKIPSARSESRPHSPSPASFSRPRPSSISHGRSTPSPITPSITASRSVRAQKTASRIPIPEPTKGTLVDVKPRGSTSTNAPSIKSIYKSTQAPSFGTRRLDAAGALEKLDQGMKRRQLSQLKRTTGFDSSTTTLSTTDKTFGPSAGSVTDRSRASTPDNTFATSSSDDEVVTPSWPHGRVYDGDASRKYDDNSPAGFYRRPAATLLDNPGPSFDKGPPSTSPYTVPLQTIPSQAALPFYPDVEDTLDLHPTISDFPDPHDRVPITLNGYSHDNKKQSWKRQPLSTNYSFMDLLDEYTDQDGRISTEGLASLDKEAKKHITGTLSILEGKGAPFNDKVDKDTLQERFGHVKCGIERATKEASFMNNAAAAQKFLAQGNSSTEGSDIHGLLPQAGNHKTDIIDDIKPQLPQIEPIASKWSDSTSSLQPVLPDLVDIPPRQMYTMATDDALPQIQRKAVPEPPRSIGYPSRVESKKAMALIGPGSNDLSPLSGPTRRLSPPTLGKRKPGSVKAARETLPHRGFSRPTASAEAKKATKMPTPNTKPFNLNAGPRRGRTVSAEKSRAQFEGNVQKAKRVRSRSRLVMDKLHGMFSHRRKKRASNTPQVPAVEDTTPKKADESTAHNATPAKLSNLAQSSGIAPSASPAHHTPRCKDSRLTSIAAPSTGDKPTATSHDDRSSVLSWGEKLRAKAAHESDPVRKLRLLEFVQVLRESYENARNAQISCLAAREAAVQASASYALVQQGMTMLQRLAAQIGGPDG